MKNMKPFFLASKFIRIENYRKQSKFFKIIITANNNNCWFTHSGNI